MPIKAIKCASFLNFTAVLLAFLVVQEIWHADLSDGARYTDLF